MIKLATVFSGIGAVEHALDRMGLEHEIIFACDNGDIDVLSKKIEVDIDQIESELNSLVFLINDINFSGEDDYEMQLLNMLDLAKKEHDSIKEKLTLLTIDEKESTVRNILESLIETPNLNKSRLKQYKNFIDSLDSNCSIIERKLILYQIILKISNDFKRDNPIENLGKDNMEFNSPQNINWVIVNHSLKRVYDILERDDAKRIINNVRNLSQRVEQLHAKINSLHHLRELSKIVDYSEKKKYVDRLYEGCKNKNKVKISYMTNYDCSEENFHWDATFLDGTQYKDKVDLFVGGSPCQSFSLVGKHRGLSDTRGTLFYEYARLVKEIQPKIFIYENVKAVLSNDCGRTWEKMKEVFEDLGYNVYYEINGKPSILNARDYGIPQNRERLFVIGFHSDLELEKDFEFPKSIPLEKKMKDFLMDDAPGKYFLGKKGVAFVNKEKNLNKKFTQINGDIALCQKKNQEFNWNGDFIFQSEEDARKYNIEDFDKYLDAQPVQKIIFDDGSEKFSIDNFNNRYSKGRIRKLTPRECLRLMGFEDDWKIAVSDTAMYQQAGNSIVVNVLINIIDEIIKSYPTLIE